MKKVGAILLAALIIGLVYLAVSKYDNVPTEEEVIKQARSYCKCTLLSTEQKEDTPGKTNWTIYHFQDKSLGFTFEFVVYKKYPVIAGKNFGPGRVTWSCNWEARRNKYLNETNKPGSWNYEKNPIENPNNKKK